MSGGERRLSEKDSICILNDVCECMPAICASKVNWLFRLVLYDLVHIAVAPCRTIACLLSQVVLITGLQSMNYYRYETTLYDCSNKSAGR